LAGVTGAAGRVAAEVMSLVRARIKAKTAHKSSAPVFFIMLLYAGKYG
jgi:hypothetical protein